MRKALKWTPLVVLFILFSCTSIEDLGSFSLRAKRGVYGYLTPVVVEDGPSTKARMDGLNYRFEKDDRINIWSGTGTLVLYNVTQVTNDGKGAEFNGGGFTLTEGETYYSSHPLIRSVLDDYKSLPVTYADQKQTADENSSHLTEYTYSFAKATCSNGNTSFQYNKLNSYLLFEITLPETLTLTELNITASGEGFFALNGTVDATAGEYGVFTPGDKTGDKTSIMTLLLDDGSGSITVSDGKLTAYLAVSPCDAGDYVIRLKASDGKVYTSPVITKTAIAAGVAKRFATEVFEGTNPAVAKIGDDVYPTLAEAVAAVPTDGTETTITMIGNDAVASGVTVAAGQNIILELNGKTISGNTDSETTYALITNKGTLVIQDNTDTELDGTGSGLITTFIANPDGGDIPGYASNTITNNGSLTVKSGKIVNNGNGYACYAIDNQTNGTAYSPVLNVEGGRMQQMNAYTYAVRMFCNSTTNVNSVAVSGGVIEGGYGLWLQTPNTKANKASLTITGGTINANDGAALYVGGTKADNSSIAISISAGQINGTGVIIQGPLSGTYGEVSISGGEIVNVQCGANVESFISGGVFKNPVNDAYCAEGYIPADNTNPATMEEYPYTVLFDAYVAMIGETKYETLAAAVTAAQNGETIVMIADETIEGNSGVTIPADKSVVLDLNGKTVTLNVAEAKASQLIRNEGTLTITDSSVDKDGMLTNAASDSYAGNWPESNFATNIISNSGTLTIEAGTIQNNANGSICYAVDNNSTSYDAVLNVNGGYLTAVGTVIRQFCNSTVKQNVVNVSGGTIETNGSAAIWTQLPGSNASSKKLATFNVTGGVIRGASYAWYDYSYGDSFEAVNYSISGGELYGYLYSYAVKNGVKYDFVSGGLFSVPVGAYYVEDGFMCAASTSHPGMYELVPAEVYYYWFESGQEVGEYYAFSAPFVNNYLCDGEFITLLKDVSLAGDFACQLESGTFALKLGNYSITKGGFSVSLKPGVSVKTDKRTDIFSASEAGYEVFETAISEGDFIYQYTVAKAVAQVGTTSYATLAEAAAAAAAASPASATITLVDDVDLGETVVISGNVTLDLNGKTINNTNDIWVGDNWSLISVQGAGSSLTIQGNGTLDAKENDCYAIDVCDGATLTVKNGVFYGNISAIYAYEGIVTVEGGEFHVKQLSEFNDARYLLNCLDASYRDGTSNFIVSGGSFYNFDPGNNAAEGIGTDFLASGYATTSTTSGSNTIYTVVAAAATVNGTPYTTLAAAAAAAAASPSAVTIKLADNVDLSETVVISGNVTLDLNGKTINNTNDIWVGDNWSLISVQGAGSSLTIQGNGTLDAKENDCYAIDVCDGATLTVKNGVFYGNISAIYAYEGIVTVEGGEFHVKQLSEFNDARYLLNCLDASYRDGTSNFIVSGGTFYNFDPGNNAAEGSGTNFLASGHTTTSSTSGSDTIYVVQ